MWSGGLLLSITLLGLIVSGRTQQILLPPSPDPPVPTESCSAPVVGIPAPAPKCDYAMMVPFKLTSKSEVSLCSWLRSEEPVNVDVSLEYFDQKISIVSKTDVSNYFECTNFTVPKVDKVVAAYFTYSAAGKNVQMRDRKPAAIDVPKEACIAMKDQPIYKPGDTVNVRLVCFDENMKQVTKQIQKATLVDPTGARVGQYLNIPAEQGVATLTIPTSSRARTGQYTIQIDERIGNIEYVTFEIEQYDLPRLEFRATCPGVLTIVDKSIDISGSAQYVYGKPVPGTVVTHCCRKTPKYGLEANCFRGVDDICQNFTQEMDKNGKFTTHINLSKFQLPLSGLDNYVTCDITLKEEGTGVQEQQSCYLWISNKLANLQLDRTSIGRFYNQINIPFAATLQDDKQRPLPNELITVRIDGNIVMYVRTDANGRAECVIDTSSHNNPNITLTATYENPDLCYISDNYGPYQPSDEMVLYRMFSHSQSHIRIRQRSDKLPCYENYRAQVDYLFTKEGVGKDVTSASINYIVLSRNKFATHGKLHVNLSESYSGSVFIDVYLDHNMATGGTLLVFAFLEKDVISATATMNVGACFENKVNMTFTKPIVKPGETVERIITAEPGSFCALRAIDSALKLLRPYDDLTADNVYSLIASYVYRFQYGDIEYKDPEPPCVNGNTQHFSNGMYCSPTSSYTDGETFQHFEGSAILIFSNLGTRRPKMCGEENERYFPFPFVTFSNAESSGDFLSLKSAAISPPGSIDTFRYLFKEKFGFDLTTTGPDGTSKVSSIIPDSITTWESDGLCISLEKGLGLTTESAKTTTFLDFFVTIPVPVVVVRGEKVVITPLVSNYMKKCSQISLQVEQSDNYNVTFLGNSGEKCACNEQVFWTAEITFNKIGLLNITVRAATSKISDTCDGPNDDTEASRSDTVQLTINVKPEGIKQEESSSHLIILNGSATAVSIPVIEPDNLVNGSFTLIAKAMGNPSVLSVQQLETLLSTPSGSCDQMQGSLQSIAFLMKNLNASGKLSEDQLDRIKAKLITGYMDLTACRQFDGSSILYPSLPMQNFWGTLLMLRTINYISLFTFIDSNGQNQALIFLSSIQNLETGCFDPKGSWFWDQSNDNNNILQFTALAVVTLGELGNTSGIAGPMLKLAEKCVNDADYEDENILTLSLLVYAAASSAQWEKWDTLKNILMEKATYDGEYTYWKLGSIINLKRLFPVSNSGDVICTALILRSMTQHPNLDQDLLNIMGSLAKYLSGQLSPNGGCFCAQATSIIIEALTSFETVTNVEETEATVSLYRNEEPVHDWSVNKENEFIVQDFELTEPFGDFKVISTGTGRVFFQLVASYNTKISPDQNAAILVTAEASPSDCINGVAKLINIQVTLRFNGVGEKCGSTVLSVRIYTGYELEYGLAKQQIGVAELLIDENVAYFFLEEVTREGIAFNVPMSIRHTVNTYQSATFAAQILDTGESGGTQCPHPCASQPA